MSTPNDTNTIKMKVEVKMILIYIFTNLSSQYYNT